MIAHLIYKMCRKKASGILPADSVQKTGYGNFVHLMDPEGNKIELWEHNDVEFAKNGLHHHQINVGCVDRCILTPR